MPYRHEISRKEPSCMLFLIDQSGSMDDPLPGAQGKKKANAVADAVNRLLSDLIIKCTKSEGVRYYYDVGVIGYGSRVGPAFEGALVGRGLVPIPEVEANPARIEDRKRKEDDGAGSLVEVARRFPVWFDPIAYGGTPMCEAIRLATSLLQEWTSQHQQSFPPIVINITDGESTDGEPTEAAHSLTSLATSDGNVLFFNCHISSREASPIVFPDDDALLPDVYAKLLFEVSSLLPDAIKETAAAEGYSIGACARGFAFNADLVELIRFIDIGTKGPMLR